MLNFKKWFKEITGKYSNRIYLHDQTRQVTYAENYITIQKLAAKLQVSVIPKQPIVFFGSSSIESYQLYFAVLSLNVILIPISYRLDSNTVTEVLKKINPTLIIFDDEALTLKNKLETTDSCKWRNLSEIFNNLESVEFKENGLDILLEDNLEDAVCSGYLTSGSTGIPKIVLHGWYATLQHAIATVDRYGLTPRSRLFNPRQIFHVSGVFPLTTFMQCGGSIVIPDASNQTADEKCFLDWSRLIKQTGVTHISFLPIVMYKYAEFMERHPELIPVTLERITTGGEAVEFSQLVEVGRAFAANKKFYDFVWWAYKFLPKRIFILLKLFYETFYGLQVQITQSFGATELICNAVANSPGSGPDPRGVGIAINSLHPEIVDERGMILPCGTVGRLRFFGSSIASGYLGEEVPTLVRNCYQPGDLAKIDREGRITFFGRSEDLIKLPQEKNKINPLLFEREIKKISGIANVVILKYQDTLHAAIKLAATADPAKIFKTVKQNEKFSLITTLSIWTDFPVMLGGKVDRKSLQNQIEPGTIDIIDIKQWQQPVEPIYSKFKSCLIM